MKKILIILFSLTLVAAPARAQLLGELGGAALKAAGTLVGKTILNKVAEKIEDKVDDMAENTITKVLGEQVDSTGTATGMQGISNAIAGFGALMEKSQAAGMAPLRDFSAQNAARKEHNLELIYDDWD